jgi:hypothetical protein
MRSSLIASIFALSMFAACSDNDADNNVPPGSTITVENDSSFTITAVQVAPSGSVAFGNNLLPGPISPGASVTMVLACNTFDVQITDNAGRTCQLQTLDLCFADAIWHVSDQMLASCGF